MNDWSCEYEFDELEIELDGVRVGSFRGIAELADNGDGQFYVRAITLDGEKVVKVRRPLGNLKTIRTPGHVRLQRAPYDGAGTLSQHLYKAIEASLYADTGAAEFFAAEVAELAA